MAAYGPQGLPDPYAWPGSHVLKNKWGITDGNDLAVMELSSTRFRIDQLRERPIKGNFDPPAEHGNGSGRSRNAVGIIPI
jgi:fido (protein-threonine AMPylation protein)